MEKQDIMKSAAKTFAAIKVGGNSVDAKLKELDRGILEVALMIAALDGSVLPSEYEAFVALVKKCRGANATNNNELFYSATAKAGQLVAMACSGLYSESQRLATFVKHSQAALPKGFAYGSLVDIRRAFALFTAMGVSDGDFSDFERRCVKMLLRRFLLSRAGKAKKFAAVLEPDFFAKAEKICRNLSSESRRAKAEKDLSALVLGTPVRPVAVSKRRRSATLRLPQPGPIITSWK